MKTVHVVVTQEIIEDSNAERIFADFYSAPRDCPIAKACTKAFGRPTVVSNRRIENGFYELPYVVPEMAIVSEFIHNFDARQPVLPFEFDVLVEER